MSIPASQTFPVTPSVLSGGGAALDLIGLFLTTNPRFPIGTVPSFPSALAVSQYAGPTSPEYLAAQRYFSGFIGSNKLPGAILFSQYPTAPVSAYLRGGSVAPMTVAQLQALSGSLDVVIDGTLKSAASVNLATATSFTAAAEMLGTGLGILGTECATFTGSISTTVLTVTSMTTGTLNVGDVISGTGVTAGTYITSAGTTSGTWNLSVTQTVATEAMTANNPGVGFDTISQAFVINSGTTGTTSTLAYATGTLSASLNLTQATGAVLSQGAIAATPASAMNSIISSTTNWATFKTLFDPDNGSGNTQKLAFAAWNSAQNGQFLYVPSDSDITPTESTAATSSLGYLLTTDNYNGSAPIYEPTPQLEGAFVMGAIASIDFTEKNGRVALGFKSSAGMAGSVTDGTVAANLKANGYNYYGVNATANQQFTYLYPGTVSGPYKTIGSYVNQIWMSNQFQLAMIGLMTSIKYLGYGTEGGAMIESALGDPILAALNFGAIQTGVQLSQAQAAEVNAAAGLKIDGTLSSRGYYLQVLPASAAIRAVGGSPPCTFWYTDGGEVRSLAVASINIQ